MFRFAISFRIPSLTSSFSIKESVAGTVRPENERAELMTFLPFSLPHVVVCDVEHESSSGPSPRGFNKPWLDDVVFTFQQTHAWSLHGV